MISRREPHEHAIDQQRPRNHIIQILTAAFYGSPPVFLVSPIFIANRRSIPRSRRPRRRRRLHCRGCALSFVRKVVHFCANVRACRSDFMITLVGYAKSPRKYDMHDTLFAVPACTSPLPPPAQPHFPIFRSLDRIFCLLVDLGEFVCTLSARCRGKCIASTPRNIAGSRALKQGQNLHPSPFMVNSSLGVNVLIVNNPFTSVTFDHVEGDTKMQIALSHFLFIVSYIN